MSRSDGAAGGAESLRRYRIRGVEVSVVDTPESIATDIIAAELESDVYGVGEVPFAAGDQVIDIGAHVGMFCIYLAKRHPEVAITAFEPDPVNFRHLQANLARNGVSSVRAVPRAVTADGRAFPMWAPGHNSGGAGGYYRCTEGFRRSVVDSCTLSGILDGYGIGRCRLLKIDCEGAEHEILRDEDALRRIEWLAGEFHTNAVLRDRGCTIEALWTAVARHFPPPRMHVSTVSMGE
ncbi:MAG TPA: FkbM family methyltransferase [Longimicrobiaceae bacterium]|nr:FkbM family methyltransferase [Longimicrobiaceae bacterium]